MSELSEETRQSIRMIYCIKISPHFSQDSAVIAQGFGFTGNFLDEWNTSVYCRVQKIAGSFKEQARIHHSCEKWGLANIKEQPE